MKYNVYDRNGLYLGTIHGRDSEEALEEAIQFGMLHADHVEERDEINESKEEH